MAIANSLLFWRIMHKLGIYAPPALGTGYGIVLGLAAQARSGTDARAFFDNQIIMWRAIVLAPFGLYWFFGLIFVWLIVVFWTGSKLHAAEHADRPPQPAAIQPRRQAVSPRSIDQANRLAAQSQTSRARVVRDAPLQEALVYCCIGHWGETADVLTTKEQSELWQERKREIEQLAADGQLSMWGKLFSYSGVDHLMDQVHQLIPADFWHENTVNWLSLLSNQTLTEGRNGDKHGRQFSDIMVSKGEIAKHFPPPLRTSNDGKS